MFVRETCVVSIRLHRQKLRVHQRVKHQLADRPLDPTQTLHLLGLQTQSRHFQILSANPLD